MTRCCCKAQGTQVSNLETFTPEDEALPKEELVKKESKRAARCAPKPKPAEPKPAAPKPAEATPAVPKAVSTVEVEDGMVVWTLPRRSFVSLEFVEDDVPLVNLDQNLMLDNVGQVHETCLVLCVEDDVSLVNLDEKLVLDKDGGVVEIKEPPQPPQPPQVPTIERVTYVCCVCLLRASGARAWVRRWRLVAARHLPAARGYRGGLLPLEVHVSHISSDIPSTCLRSP